MNNFEQHKSVVDGLEVIADLLVCYTAIEKMYADKNLSILGSGLEAAIVQLYSEILHFQAQAATHFSRPPFSRMARNIGKFDDWQGLKKRIIDCHEKTFRLLGLVDTAVQYSSTEDIHRKLDTVLRFLDPRGQQAVSQLSLSEDVDAVSINEA